MRQMAVTKTKEKKGRQVVIQKQKTGLTLQMEEFCQLYATNREFFGNGTQAYIEAYYIDVNKPGKYRSAIANASRLLTKDNILRRINELLKLDTLNDSSADRTLAFWMEQRAHPTVSMDAVKEYNKLKGRITEKVEKKVLVAGVVAHIYDKADKEE